MAIKPLGNRLLLQAPSAPTRIGTIWIPPSAEHDYTICQAEVIERGDGVRDVRLQPGARIICKRFGRFALSDGTFVVQEEQVLALIDVSVL